MTDQEGSCGWNLAATYILSSNFQPDRSCIEKIIPIDFAGTTMKSKQSAIQLFGTDDIWGTNDISSISTSPETIKNIAINIKYTLSLFISLFIIYLTS